MRLHLFALRTQTTTTTTTTALTEETSAKAFTAIDNGQLAIQLTQEFASADALQESLKTNDFMDGLLQSYGAEAYTMQANPTTIITIQVYKSSDDWLKLSALVGANPKIMAMITSIKSIVGYVVGDVTAKVKEAVAGWNSLPMIQFTCNTIAVGFMSAAVNPDAMAFSMDVEHTDVAAMNAALAQNDSTLSIAMNTATSFIHVVTGPTTLSTVGIFPSEAAYLKFNTALTAPELMPALMASLDTMVSGDCTACGVEADATKAVLGGWNALPQINLAMVPTVQGGGSDGALIFCNETFFESAAAMAAAKATWEPIHAAGKGLGMPLNLQIQTGESSCIAISAFRNNAEWAAFNTMLTTDSVLAPLIPDLLDAQKMVVCHVMGSVTKPSNTMLAGWNAMPNIHIMPDVTTAFKLGSPGCALICWLKLSYVSAEALASAVEMNVDPIILDAMDDTGCTMAMNITGPTSAVQLFSIPSSEAWLRFNAAQKPLWTEARIATVASLECTYVGDLNAEGQAAMDAWDGLPQFDVKRSKVISGYPSFPSEARP